FSEGGYIAAMCIEKALNAVHGDVTNKAKLLQALHHTDLKDAPRGPMKLDQFGNPIDNIYIYKQERVNGKLQNTVITTYPMVSQFWKYNPEQVLKQPSFSKEYPPCTYCTK